MIAATIEAGLQLLREKLDQTIVPMQRIIELLHAEFVAMRETQAVEGMQQATRGIALVTQNAKRLRIGSVA